MPNSITESIGDRLRQARRKRGFTQAKFADSLSIPARTYLGWEYGTTEPSARGLKALRNVHQIDLPWLLTGTEAQSATISDQISVERISRIFGEVDGIYRKAGKLAPPRAILAVSAAIYNEAPEREASELEKLMLYLNTEPQPGGEWE